MGLTIADGPLSSEGSHDVNYRVDGPERLLFFGDFPRRVRAGLAGQTVLDTRHGQLLHESGLLPVLYVPDADVDSGLLRATDHTTHCPFKGDACYWSVQTGGRTAENAVWAYPGPIPSAQWLRGYKAVDWDAMDAWYDEDEEVFGHLRDPYHRVDVRATSRPVRVVAGDEVLAQTTRAKVLSETGLPNRYYLPRADVSAELRPAETTTVCPYKGIASYWSAGTSTDVAWSYEEPLEDALKIQAHVTFDHDNVSVQVG
jgi:uncharacterized protein (DUF427 family)